MGRRSTEPVLGRRRALGARSRHASARSGALAGRRLEGAGPSRLDTTPLPRRGSAVDRRLVQTLPRRRRRGGSHPRADSALRSLGTTTVNERSPLATSACRLCGQPLSETFVDLGLSPLSNSYVTPARLSQPERFYPLRVFVCGNCLLVQLEEFESPEHIFSDYLYFSSFSDLWLAHCRAYADRMVERFGLGARSQVVEVASNDGYLLQYFLPHGVPVLGIEPAANVAETAISKGIPTEVAFFGTETANRLRAPGVEADLIAGNNVLAHVPRLLDFVQGLQILLKPEGVVTIEVPHLLRLVAENQFDTIYHEHFSYFSLLVLQTLFATVDMRIVDVEELWTHGGSLRVYVRHANAAGAPTQAVADVLARERAAGLDGL